MANVDGTLRFDTKLDTKGIDTGLKSVDDKLKGIQKSATIGLGAIATGLVAAGTAGVKFNAEMEQYTATFETFTGSADKAAETMDRLLELGAKTPFETTDLANATQLLMAYGFSADEAVDSLTMLGDASQGNVEKLNSIATGFARMKSSGKVTLEYLNLMIENGFNPLNQVAEDTGMTMAEVYDAISAGEITFEQVESAMVKMTSEGGQYFGLMEKQSQTLNGRLSTLSDTIQMKLGEAFQGITDVINQMLPIVIEMIENIDIETLANGILTISIVLGSILATATALRGVIALFNFVTMINSLGGLAGILASTSSYIGLIATTLAPVIVTVGSVIAVVTALTLAIKDLWDNNEQFRQAVTEAWDGISKTIDNLWKSVLKPIFEGLLEVIKNVYTNGIKPLWDQFVEFVGVVIISVSSMWSTIEPIINLLIQYLGPIISGVLVTLAGIFGNTVNTILNLMSGLLGTLSGIVESIKQVFNGIINFLSGVFTGNWKKAWQGVVDIFGGIFGGIVNIAKAPINGLIGLVNKAIDGLNSLSVDIPDWVPFAGGQHWGVNIGKIPYLEKGGILNKGQMGFLEGNGAEAVVPLERNKYWVNAVAREFAKVMPQMAGGQTINFYSTVETPDEVSRKLRVDARLGLIG